MAVHDCVSKNLCDNDDDDDQPIVFKRSSAASKQSQLNSALKKSSSQRAGRPSEKPASGQSSPIGGGSNFRKSETSASNAGAGRAGAPISSSAQNSPSGGGSNLRKSEASASNAGAGRAGAPISSYVQSSPSGRGSNLQKSEALASNAGAGRAGAPISSYVQSSPSGRGSNLQKSEALASNAGAGRAGAPISSSAQSSSGGGSNLRKSEALASNAGVGRAGAPISSSAQNSPSGGGSNLRKSEALASNARAGRAGAPVSSNRTASSVRLKSSSSNGTSNLNGNTPDSDDSDDDKPLSFRLSAAPQKNSSLAKLKDRAEDSDDSDDDKPLSFRVSARPLGGQKSNASNAKKLQNSSVVSPTSSQMSNLDIKKYSDDSEDEKPLSFRLQSKPVVGKSTRKADDSNEEKPLASKLQQNGSNKRPLASVNKSGEPSNKKTKLLDSTAVKVKHEAVVKEEVKDDDDDHIPIAQRTKKLVSNEKQSSMKKVIKKVTTKPFKKGKMTKKAMKDSKYSKSFKVPPGSGEGQKWTTLVHNGVIFPPPYKPHRVKMLYNGKPVDLTPEQEEVATMFAVMKDTEYATKKTFIDNFMNDWRAILGSNHIIKQFELCDFTPIYEWHLREKEKKKQMSSEEKKAVKEEKLKQEEKYMWAVVDGVKEKVGNFRVEPPGLFRGRGEHPKMGKLKKRIRPRDITINIGKDAPIPECPISGERWKEIRHDNTVTWLAFWNDPINQKEFKYVFLAASSTLKGQSDKEKYEKARKLKDYIQNIRSKYTKDFTSKDDTKRQIAVATYLIDKLALRAGNEKEEGEEADTVGCCTLKVENVMLVPPNKLQFDFLGKDSIRYFNTVEVELAVYKAIGDFRTKNLNGKKKHDTDPLFHMLDTNKLNAHLKELMPGLTAKVFRTYNASITLDEMLNKETNGGTVLEKLAIYQQANKEVAIICNHQRSVSKSHDAQMTRLTDKLAELKAQHEELKVDLSRARKGKPPLKDAEGKTKRNLSPEALEKKLAQLDAKIEKIELDIKLKEDLKTVALGTSKINYLDPRISVAWCKRHEVPIEKIFNKSLLAKFAWAMDAEPSFRF